MSDVDQIVQGAVERTAKRPKQRTRPPQVSLLPTEIRSAGRSARVRGLLAAGTVAVVVLTAGGVALASSVAADADQRSQETSQRLLASSMQLAKFDDVQSLQQRIALGDAAVRVGGSTQIDWQRVQTLLLADKPFGFTVTSITADGATPTEDYAQGDSPLEKPRAATVTITAKTASLSELPVWLRKLKSVPSYADALPPAVSADDGGYTVVVTVHLTTAAYVTPLKGK